MSYRIGKRPWRSSSQPTPWDCSSPDRKNYKFSSLALAGDFLYTTRKFILLDQIFVINHAKPTLFFTSGQWEKRLWRCSTKFLVVINPIKKNVNKKKDFDNFTSSNKYLKSGFMSKISEDCGHTRPMKFIRERQNSCFLIDNKTSVNSKQFPESR